MKLNEAVERACKESLHGYVQHVNRVVECDGMFYVSDWFDYELTVVSFENGITIWKIADYWTLGKK